MRVMLAVGLKVADIWAGTGKLVFYIACNRSKEKQNRVASGAAGGGLCLVTHPGEMLCGPFVPSNKPGSVAALGLEEDGTGRNIACPGSGSITKPALREGAEWRGALVLSVLAKGSIHGA